ncbi:hypothetical protein SAMN02745163_03651 [Clostridium cavendishii DSM 21758]|uniref:Uncharacterized protein n=1 Tax=Clostridium cavendishii DSM 21758 TaxID=1121302 RepID=A0A1M6RR95_9CLOT|nr:hypothetical protein [Clostridium cavendishii]SHK34973.1 hypothetical protein SAMN02745163_03651 [Clostridium cavendishii DSM 21758]
MKKVSLKKIIIGLLVTTGTIGGGAVVYNQATTPKPTENKVQVAESKKEESKEVSKMENQEVKKSDSKEEIKQAEVKQEQVKKENVINNFEYSNVRVEDNHALMAITNNNADSFNKVYIQWEVLRNGEKICNGFDWYQKQCKQGDIFELKAYLALADTKGISIKMTNIQGFK